MSDVVAVLIGSDWYPVVDESFEQIAGQFIFYTQKSGGDKFIIQGPYTSIVAVKRRAE